MSKSILIVVAVMFLFSIQSFASFRSSECSSSNANISYSYMQSWNMPVPKTAWKIDGVEYSPNDVSLQLISGPNVIEEKSNEMTGYRIYLKNVNLTYLINGSPRTIEGLWLLCRDAAGI